MTAQQDQTLAKTIVNYRFILIGMVLTFIGIISLLPYAFNPESEKISYLVFLRDFGLALLPAGTILLIVEFLIRSHYEQLILAKVNTAINENKFLKDTFSSIRLANEIREMGVRKLYFKRPSLDTFIEILKSSDKGTEIKILAIAFTALKDRDMKNALLGKLNDDCKIKLLCMNPNAKEAVEQRAFEEDRQTGDMMHDIQTNDEVHKNFINQLPDENKQKFKCSSINFTPAYFIFCVGKTMIVGFYLAGNRGTTFPHLELSPIFPEEKGMFFTFEKYFDSLWEWSNRSDVKTQLTNK